MWRHFAGRDFPLEGFCERLFPVEGFGLGGISPHSPNYMYLIFEIEAHFYLQFFMLLENKYFFCPMGLN